MSKFAKQALNRGSEWHRWEPHVHSPGTLQNDGYKGDDLWEKYLTALEDASPVLKAIGITDYCVTASYERARAAKNAGRLSNCDLLFPNIELRLNTGTVKGNFVNVHLLVSPEDPDHVEELKRFLAELKFKAHDDTFSCTRTDLIRLGKRADPNLKNEDEAALRHGCLQFKVSREGLVEAYENSAWARENVYIAVAGNADGTSGVRDSADETLRKEIEKIAHAIFAASPKQRTFWLGDGAAALQELHQLYGGPKPCLWGSDAHELSRVAKPEQDRHCWIKGQPSFDALRQAFIDPERAFIGSEPPASGIPSQVLSDLEVADAPWFRTKNLVLNPGLVAVVGARGSGKTALADILAAATDSYQDSNERPSFLQRARDHLTGATELEQHSFL